MKFIRLIPLFLVTALLAPALHAAPPGAAPAPMVQGPTRVAVVKTFTVFIKIPQYKAWSDKLSAMQRDLQGEEQRRAEEIRTTQGQLESTLPSHPSYQKILETLDKQKADYQAWGASSKVKLERLNKKMLVELYGEIEDAVAQIAQQNGIDLVISDNRQEIVPERISQEELSRILGTRPVLYANKNVDITELVITLLDAEFAKNPGGAGPAPIAPQPPPATGGSK